MAETKEEEKITLELTYKEAAGFHLVYFLGALVLNGETSRIPEHWNSALSFCDKKLTDNDVLTIRQKASRLVDEIPLEVKKELGLITIPERL